MTQPPDTPSEEDLHAYVDDMLDETTSAHVASWLAKHPESAAQIEIWRRQNARIRRTFAPYARAHAADVELVCSRRSRQAQRPVRWRAAAAAAAVFVAGIGIGFALTPSLGSLGGDRPEDLAQQAADSFAIYSVEVRHPVEVGSDQQDHLVAWLSKRLDHALHAPDLASFGFGLVGGRLLPVNGKAGAMLMYENDAGNRLTVMIARSADRRDTGFRFADQGPVRTFYWIDRDIGYAISGELDRPDLAAVAEAVYGQLQPDAASS